MVSEGQEKSRGKGVGEVEVKGGAGRRRTEGRRWERKSREEGEGR